jgi:hypothetical protein
MTILRVPVARIGLIVAAIALASGPASAQMKHMTDAEMIEHLKGSAPPAVLDNATILNTEAWPWLAREQTAGLAWILAARRCAPRPARWSGSKR